jgi:dienelactone hydrolase
MKRPAIFLYMLLAAASSASHAVASQGPAPAYAFPPPAAGVTVVSDVEYGRSGTTTLAMDVYRPPSGSSARPALVFFNRATGADRKWDFYASWARTAASRGLVAIVPDIRGGSEADDFKLLLSHLEQKRSDYGFDGIAVYAASGNVSAALPAVQDPKLTAVKAVVIYYGTANVQQFRLDLPILFVRAGLDRPPLNEAIATLAARAIAQNAPFTLLNYAGGHHGFEAIDNTETTRRVIDDTLTFVLQATSAPYQAALRASLGEATAAGYVQTGKFKDAADEYARMVAAKPEDHRLRLSYGEALLGDKQYAAACGEFEKLRDKPLGPRDRGLPAAHACLMAGDAAAAVAWLNTIPARFLPASVAQDPRFAALKDRPDFQALFTRK